MSSRESRRDEYDRIAGFYGKGAGFSNPLWDKKLRMFYCGAGLYRSPKHPVIKKRIAAGKLAAPPKERG